MGRKYRKYNRKAFAKEQFDHCLNMIKLAQSDPTKCLFLDTGQSIRLTIDKYEVDESGCGRCKEKYDCIDIWGVAYGLDDEIRHGIKYWCTISQFYVLCVCDEEDIETINVEYDYDEHDLIRSYDLLFKFYADNDLMPQFVIRKDQIKVTKRLIPIN